MTTPFQVLFLCLLLDNFVTQHSYDDIVVNASRCKLSKPEESERQHSDLQRDPFTMPIFAVNGLLKPIHRMSPQPFESLL